MPDSRNARVGCVQNVGGCRVRVHLHARLVLADDGLDFGVIRTAEGVRLR